MKILIQVDYIKPGLDNKWILKRYNIRKPNIDFT